MAPVIEVKGLSVNYGRKRVLTNIFLKLESGHRFGILGPNGAGKSTLFKAILGLLEPTAGEIRVYGDEIEHHRKRVAYVPQKDDVDWQFPATAMDIVLMGRYPHLGVLERLGKKDRDIAEAALEKMGIIELRSRQIGQLSGGQQQRVFIARALAQQADIFFLDEPFVGVDMTTEEKIIELLKDLSDEGKTALVVHHDLSTVSDYFDQVVLLNQRLIAAGETHETFNAENLAKAYGSQLNILHKT